MIVRVPSRAVVAGHEAVGAAVFAGRFWVDVPFAVGDLAATGRGFGKAFFAILKRAATDKILWRAAVVADERKDIEDIFWDAPVFFDAFGRFYARLAGRIGLLIGSNFGLRAAAADQNEEQKKQVAHRVVFFWAKLFSFGRENH